MIGRRQPGALSILSCAMLLVGRSMCRVCSFRISQRSPRLYWRGRRLLASGSFSEEKAIPLEFCRRCLFCTSNRHLIRVLIVSVGGDIGACCVIESGDSCEPMRSDELWPRRASRKSCAGLGIRPVQPEECVVIDSRCPSRSRGTQLFDWHWNREFRLVRCYWAPRVSARWLDRGPVVSGIGAPLDASQVPARQRRKSRVRVARDRCPLPGFRSRRLDFRSRPRPS
jgi:hypothetical protein